MAKQFAKIAKLLGAEIVGEMPETGGGAFGAARAAQRAADFRNRGKPAGRKPRAPKKRK